MGIQMRPEGIRHVPIVYCDRCGNQIEKADDGVFVYRVDGEHDKTISFLCNGVCLKTVDMVNPDLGTVPLAAFPIYFMNVMGIEFDKASAVANALSRL